MVVMEGCPCLDTTSLLSSLTDRYCTIVSSGQTGLRLTLGGSCVPFSYGASQCRQHDLLHDSSCKLDQLFTDQETSSGNNTVANIVPAYCFRAFCYVDAKTCKKYSEERVYRSGYFGHANEENENDTIDIFYSYSKCNSTADDWLEVEDDIVGGRALGGIDIEAAVPTYVEPYMYKRDSEGEVLLARGDEYYDDSIPYDGVYIHFAKQIMEISKGDIRSMNFTHRSRVSGIVHPSSSFTAAVQDIEDGLVDMAVGPFWITSQRLRMSSFSLPFTYDKTYLVIPKPGSKDTVFDQVSKVLAPFSLGLWGLVLGVIAAAATLSVWFSETGKNIGRRMGTQKKKIPMRVYCRLALDQFLQKGLFFCSAGVEQDNGTSLPAKLLLFGFGFFILIAVSAYVANLAAFLTLSGTSDAVKSIDQAISAGYRICAHPALKVEYQIAYPDANFYFHDDGNEFSGVMDDYLAGNCQVLAIGYEDTSMDTNFLESMCTNDLVYTTSVIAETPMAFPLRQGISSGFSYWMYQGERLGVSLQTSKDEFPTQIGCDVHLSDDAEGDEMDEITVKNFFLPIIFFLLFAAIAVMIQIRHICNVKHGKRSLVGRRSSFNLMAGMNDSNGDSRGGLVAPRRQHLAPKDDEPSSDESFSSYWDKLDQGKNETMKDRRATMETQDGSVNSRSLMTGNLPEDSGGISSGEDQKRHVSFGVAQEEVGEDEYE